MKIVFFGNTTEKIAAIRYRIVRFAEMLEADGHQCIVCLPSSVALKESLYEKGGRAGKLLYFFLVLLRRIGQLRHVFGADVVYFRGPVFDYGPPLFERIIRCVNPGMVFDIDDAVWEPPAHVSSPFLRCVDFNWVFKMARMCKHGVVGNSYLEERMREYNPNLTVIPTCVDMDSHTLKDDYEHGGPVVLGWTGVRDNLGYLDIIETVLQDLAREHDLKLSVATGRDYHLDGVEVENEYWVNAREIEYLRGADIGLMPLKDTPRAKGKCAFKALQYMAVGVPPIVSPVGMNADVIDNGVDGFLAATPEEWREKLTALITDPALRRRMGAAAREKMQREYSHDANYPKLRGVMEQVGTRKK